jgi:hypothetical protein
MYLFCAYFRKKNEGKKMSVTDRLSALGELVLSMQQEIDDLAQILGLEKIEDATRSTSVVRGAAKKPSAKKQAQAHVAGKKKAGRPKGSTKAAAAEKKASPELFAN